jgi:hypothetical protein
MEIGGLAAKILASLLKVPQEQLAQTGKLRQLVQMEIGGLVVKILASLLRVPREQLDHRATLVQPDQLVLQEERLSHFPQMAVPLFKQL